MITMRSRYDAVVTEIEDELDDPLLGEHFAVLDARAVYRVNRN